VHAAGWLTVFLCFVVATFEGVDLQAAGLVAPKIAPLFHLNPGQLGWFFSASTIGLVFGALLGGRLADRMGRKLALIISIAIFGVFSVSTTWSTGFQSLVLTRLLTGLGLGGALPNLIALVSENIGAERKNLAISLMYCGMPFGGGLASLLIGFGLGGSDWRGVFYVGGLTPVLAAPVLWFVLPDSLQFAEQKASAMKASVIQALFNDGRGSRTVALWLSFFCGLLVLYLLLNWLPSMLVSRGLAKSQASMVQAVFNMLGVAGSASIGALMDGAARRWAVGGVFIALAVGLGLLALTPATFSVALLCGGFVGAATMGAQSVLYNLAPGLYPTTVRGTGLGAAVAAGRLGSVAGPLVAGTLVGQGHSPSQVLLALLPLVFVSGALALVLAWRPAPGVEADLAASRTLH
jgi:AAHS family 3-hydroxyphenylpropionic acid transporter